MTNTEKKQELFNKIKDSYEYLEDYCNITVQGLDDDSKYFHVKFELGDDVSISSQSDTGGDPLIYALRVNIGGKLIEIPDDLLDNVIIGYYKNKDAVLLALKTLVKIKSHVNKLHSYSSEYIMDIITGASVQELTNVFISELRATSQVVDFMQSSNYSSIKSDF